MNQTLVYGTPQRDLAAVQDAVAGVLAMPFALRDSDYRGGQYYLGVWPDGDEIIVQDNFWDPYDREWFEPENPDMRILVYASVRGDRGDDVERRLARVPGLRKLDTVA